MQLLDVPPCELLRDFVESYWYVDVAPHESSPRPDAILPDGTCNLIFNLSGFPHRDYATAACDRFELLRTRWLSGIRDRAIVVGPTVCTRVVGIRFRPGGLVPFLDVPARELVGMTVDADAVFGNDCQHLHEQLTVDADAVFGNDCQHLHEQLLELSCAKHQLQLLERWLLQRFDPNIPRIGLLRALRCLRSRYGNVPIEHLAPLADLSQRQFRRRFEQAIGLPPKRLARLLRFQNLIEAIGTGSASANCAGLALECGYYDQAHLIADFREFAGVTPGEYLRRKPTVPGFLPVDAPVSLFSNTASRAPVRIAAS